MRRILIFLKNFGSSKIQMDGKGKNNENKSWRRFRSAPLIFLFKPVMDAEHLQLQDSCTPPAAATNPCPSHPPATSMDEDAYDPDEDLLDGRLYWRWNIPFQQRMRTPYNLHNQALMLCYTLKISLSAKNVFLPAKLMLFNKYICIFPPSVRWNGLVSWGLCSLQMQQRVEGETKLYLGAVRRK